MEQDERIDKIKRSDAESCVDASCKGQHTGKALYEFVIDYVKKSQCYNVTLNVWACNENAMRFYEKCGLKSHKIGMETIL